MKTTQICDFTQPSLLVFTCSKSTLKTGRHCEIYPKLTRKAPDQYAKLSFYKCFLLSLNLSFPLLFYVISILISCIATLFPRNSTPIPLNSHPDFPHFQTSAQFIIFKNLFQEKISAQNYCYIIQTSSGTSPKIIYRIVSLIKNL